MLPVTESYPHYALYNWLCGAGIFLVVVAIVSALTCCTDLQIFFLKSTVGAEWDSFVPVKHNLCCRENSSQREETVTDNIPVYNTKLSKAYQINCAYFSLTIVCGLLLAAMALIIYSSCILTNVRLTKDDECPNDPVDCFVFTARTAREPIGSFRCTPKASTNLSSTYPDGYAWCYGWVITRQTTKTVLDQLGVCAGLIGLFGATIGLFSYLTKYRYFFLCFFLFWLLACLIGIPMLAVYSISSSLLPYIIIGSFLAVLCWSCCFYLIRRSDEKTICCPHFPKKVVPIRSSATPNPTLPNVVV